jgi:hypothetical protein
LKLELRITCPDSEFSKEFIQGMLNRMSFSYHKYGEIKDAFPDKIDALKSIQQRVDKYVETGNTEYLIDAANFAMIEFIHPSLTNAFFHATDMDGSPGRISKSGDVVGNVRNEEL